jgi:protoporphyrinogen oxidase
MQINSTQSWAVVGGGMLGLYAASELRKRGFDVTVFERAPEIGGLTSAWQIGDVTWDRYYHVTLLSDTTLRDLLDQLGLEKEIEWCQTRTGFYANGKLHSLSSSFEFLKFPVLNLWQKFRLGSTIFFASKIRNWRALESITVESWLRRMSGNSTFERVWLPLLKAKLGPAYTRTSAAFIWAYIDRMYKARRTGMKREMFGYVPGGYAVVLKRLYQHLVEQGVRIQTSAAIKSIAKQPDGQFAVAFGHDQSAKFDRVIVTSPTHIAADICHDLTDREREQLRRVEYLGVICTSLLLDKPLGGYYVTNIIDDWVPLTGIIEMGSILPPEKLNGNYLVYLPQYMLSTDSRFEETDEQIHARCLDTLEKMYPDFKATQVRAIQTARAKLVMSIPTIDYSQNLPPVIVNEPGLYLLNSAQIVQGTLNVNETLELAKKTLQESILKQSF